MTCDGECAERIAVALELIATRFEDPNRELVTRVVNLEEVLKDFVATMEDPRSTDQDWTDLLVDTKQILGLDTDVRTEAVNQS